MKTCSVIHGARIAKIENLLGAERKEPELIEKIWASGRACGARIGRAKQNIFFLFEKGYAKKLALTRPYDWWKSGF